MDWDAVLAAHAERLVVGARVEFRPSGECVNVSTGGPIHLCGDGVGVIADIQPPLDRLPMHTYRVWIDRIGRHVLASAAELTLIEDA